jgi:O-antigen ligase
VEWIPLSIALALAAAAFVAWRPVEATLGTYAFLVPFDAVLMGGQAGRIHLHATWFVAIGACGILSTIGLLGRGFVRPPRAALWLSLLVFWAALSSAWAIRSEIAPFRLPELLLLLLVYLVAVSSRVTEKEFDTIVWLAVLGGSVAASISLYQFSRGQYFVPPDAPQIQTGRAAMSAGAFATEPNALGATLILPFSLAAGILLSSRTWPSRLFMIGCLGLIGTCIYATMSRGAVIAIAVVVLIYLLRSWARPRVWVLLLLMGGSMAAMPGLFVSRFQDIIADRGAGRMDIWENGLQALWHYGILGVGLDRFPAAYDKFLYVSSEYRGFSRASHNIYLGTAVELGVVGITLLALIVWRHLRRATKAYGSDVNESSHIRLISYEAACWGLLVQGFFFDILWEEYLWLAWMLLIMATRARQVGPALAYQVGGGQYQAAEFKYPVGG